MNSYYQVYPSGGQWRWRLRDGNHRIIAASGESFVSRSNAERSISNLRQEAPHAKIAYATA